MMNKGLLLARAHFRKNKGSSVGLICLLILTALLFRTSLLILTDAYPLAEKEAQRLDSGDGFFRITENVEGVDEGVINENIGEDTARHYSYKCLNYIMTLPFGEGDTSVNVQFSDGKTAFHKLMANSEIVREDASITSGYVYLPYQFYTAGGFDIGDTFSYEVQGEKYELKVRGFLTTPYFGCNNCGAFEIVVDDDTYSDMCRVDGAAETYVIIYELKDSVKQSAFAIRFANDIVAAAPGCAVSHTALSESISGRTFISMIFVISFMVVTVIIMLVVLMMLVNTIGNYIKENMKTLGALKAVGYTSRDIKLSMHILFVTLAVIGSVAGILLSYVTIPLFANIVVGQMGIPYNVSFVFYPSLMILASVVVYTIIVTEIALRKIRRIEPIVALRDGTESHNFRKNRLRLDRSNMGINLALAMKTTFFNMKQNIITFLVVGAMVFLCTIGVLLYQNFNVEPRVEMMAFETCSGVIGFDNETAEEGKEYLESIEGVRNIRNIINVYFCYGEEDKIWVYIMDDVSAMNNKNVCFEGRLPQYDNEIAVSGMFCKEYGFKVGDTINLTYGDESYSYLITGLVQTTNNNGKEAVLSCDAAERVMDLEYAPAYYYFDTDDATAEGTQAVLDKCEDEFGSHMISKMNFFDIVEGALTVFRSVSVAMLATMCVVSAAVILLVLYLLIKSLIFTKKKDYGIYKAIGYTTNNLVLQTAVSFMPSIIISVLVFSVVSYFYANPVMNIAMSSFGIVKANFVVPVTGVVMVAVFMIIISFLFAIFEARRIRKIEAYNMLIAE